MSGEDGRSCRKEAPSGLGPLSCSSLFWLGPPVQFCKSLGGAFDHHSYTAAGYCQIFGPRLPCAVYPVWQKLSQTFRYNLPIDTECSTLCAVP